jgi:hypothetical protein
LRVPSLDYAPRWLPSQQVLVYCRYAFHTRAPVE